MMSELKGPTMLLFCIFNFALFISLTDSEVLNPPYFNIAEGRKVYASETCGEGVQAPEKYCKIIGAMWTDNVDASRPIGGQACDECDPNDPKKAHPPEYAVDGSPKWWQSPPLSRGPGSSRVNLTIDLGQEFNVAYVYMKMGNSPRPAIWVLERSNDYGKTYKPWMYFADSKEECVKQFGEESVQPLTRDDQVICETQYSKLLPLENGEVVISLLSKRPGEGNFTNSKELQEFTTATNVSFRFIRPKTTFGHLLNLDQTVTRRYFYSVREINIGGRCVCNGHALTCDVVNQTQPDKLYCACTHNTCGTQCERCCPGFVQKAWKPATPNNPNECERCNCNEHSDECYYDPEIEKKGLSMDIYGEYAGGGVCVKCKHNTKGINCNECKFGYYRPKGRNLNATNVCEKCKCFKFSQTGGCDEESGQCQCKANFTNAPACDECAYGYYDEPKGCPRCPCYRNGTLGDLCDPFDGKCICKDSFAGSDCSECAAEYWGFPECKRCNCDRAGSVTLNCNGATGQCDCKKSFSGQQCDKCAIGYYNYPECSSCSCNPLGTTEEVCDSANGQCKCKPGFGGARCDQCAEGFFGFPNCQPCNCDTTGSLGTICNEEGRCNCAQRYGGSKCNQCAAGYYDFPKCEACGCDPAGSIGVTCQNGVCQCRDNFEGIKCNKCKKNYYNYPVCESCSCNPAGVAPTFPGCSEVISGKLCECKEKVTGRYCHLCVAQYKNLRSSNPQGCEPCRCNRAGTLNSLDYCNGETGQCTCKETVSGFSCDSCASGSYALSMGNYLGCTACDCNIGGSYRASCDQRTGQCYCRNRIQGRRCDKTQLAHYVPTLYQYKYEMEDGRGEFHTVRYDYDETTFPAFSWKGYAKFSELQRKVIIDSIFLHRSSFYRIVYHYHNPGPKPIIANLTMSHENEQTQFLKVVFQPTTEPKRFLVPYDGPNPLYLSEPQTQAHMQTQPPPNRVSQLPWKATLSADGPLLVDYMVLLPEAYFDPTILQDDASEACTISTPDYKLCRHYGYTKLPESAIVIPKDSAASSADISPQDTRDSFLIDATMLSDQEREHIFEVDVDKSQKYVLLLNYIYRISNPPLKGQVAKLTVEVNTPKGTMNIPFQVPMCHYTFPCRHVVLNEKAAPVEFDLESGSTSVSVKLNNDIGEATFGIIGLVALPKSDWHIDHVKPGLTCIMKNFTCINSTFVASPEANKILFGERGQIKPLISSEEADNNGVNNNENNDVTERVVELVGSVPRTDNYQLIVHYYQPDYPSFEMEATFQRTPASPLEQAFVLLKHCPSKMGCRSVVKFKKPTGVLEEGKEFTLTLIPPKNRGANLDHLLVVAEKLYNRKQLDLQPASRMEEFRRNCTQDAFYIDDSASEFCKNSVFSITSDFNNGALYCKCNATGSLGFSCNPLGGQCQCKPNVIGRQCDSCRSEYWGFPNCRPCNCSKNAAYCEPTTGQCICPKGVIGLNCDRCAPAKYGYDSRMGCEDCNCHPAGVKDGNLQCDLTTGLCDCFEKYTGRACDSCKPGFFDFPVCRHCDCHFDGATADICDTRSGECRCKENVLRPACDACKRGSYNLEAANPEGCTKCFCFGTTDNCRSSNLRLKPTVVTNYANWSVVGLTFSEAGLKEKSLEPEISSTEGLLEIKPTPIERGDQNENSIENGVVQSNLYFKLPKEFLGKRITSYGSFIRYGLTEMPVNQEDYTDTPITADIVLMGRNITITATRDVQPESPGSIQKFEYELLESKFLHSVDNSPVSRAQMMMLLVDLQAIYIRGSYFSPDDTIKLSDFTIDSVTNDSSESKVALRVEQCICPPNYKGTSCEECASGYFRVSTGPYLGSCIPCQCNGHSNECDPMTGKCFNCRDDTTGDHCEKCIAGFHGDATGGKPFDCLICACPLPIRSNNFAESCELRENSRRGTEISCSCKPGYGGANCGFCTAGYYGRPTVLGDYCKPCQCHGNIDPTNPGSCDSETGACLTCLNNTAGIACELCANGYYGDAIEAKNCKPCQCDSCGTAICDRSTGECKCHKNVIGDACDECEPDHYGFNSCGGCQACNCSIASDGTNCDSDSGQCRCKPGVTGRTCNKCETGFWKYSEAGCESCGCVEKYSRGVVCNQETGRCECLPGVVGEKCDKCPWRWVFIDREGCLECGDCQHALLNDTDQLSNEINPTLDELGNSSSTIHAQKKFATLSNTVNEFNRQLNQITESSKKIDLEPLNSTFNSVEADANTLQSYQERETRHAKGVLDIVHEAKKNATLTRRRFKNLIAESEPIFMEVGNIQPWSIVSTENPEILIEKGAEVLEKMNAIGFNHAMEVIANESVAAKDILDKVKTYISPYNEDRENLNKSRKSINKLEDVLTDAKDKIDSSLFTALDVQRGLNKSRQIIKKRIVPLSDSLKAIDASIIANLKDAKLKIDASGPAIEMAAAAINDFETISKEIPNRGQVMRNRMFNTADLKDPEFLSKIDEAKLHANQLNRTATELESILLAELKQGDTNRTMRAATAYNQIEKAIGNAESTINQVLTQIESEEPLIDIAEKSSEARKASVGNRTEANALRSLIMTNLVSPLDRINETVATEIKRAYELGEVLKKVDAELNAVEVLAQSVSESYREVGSQAEANRQAALVTSNRVDALMDEIDKVLNETIELKNVNPIDFIEMKSIQTQTSHYTEQEIDRRIRSAIERAKALKDKAENGPNKMKEIAQNILKARDMVDRIDVAMKFTPETRVTLRKPANLEQLGSYTKLSTYFKTNKPDGLLAFIGNAKQTRSRSRRADDGPRSRGQTDDYIALEIRKGKLQVTLNLGNEPQSLETETFVSDGRWTNVIVERIGKTLKITTNKDDKEIVTHGHISGFSSVLNLHEDKARVFIGGIPDEYQVADTIQHSWFEGSIAHVTLDDRPIGLLNFEYATYEPNSGDIIPTPPPVKGVNFNGHGQATAFIDPNKLVQQSFIQLTVKTYARFGLLLLMAGETDYLAIQLDNGQPKAIIDLGSGYVSVTTPTQINNGFEHTISVDRMDKSITIKVNGSNIVEGETSGSQMTLELEPTLYIGGYPGKHSFAEVSTDKFEGCLNELQIDAILIKLSNISMSPGVTSGCPDSGVREAVFESAYPGYIEMPLTIEIVEAVQASFKFRSSSSEGLLFYAAHPDGPDVSFIAVYLLNGILIFQANPGRNISTPGLRYDDNQWHYVIATKGTNQLRLDIDDSVEVDLDNQNNALNIPAGSFYFGGAPSGHIEKLKKLGLPTSFVGCLGDAVVHDKFQDLRKRISAVGATLVTCKELNTDQPSKLRPTPAPLITPSENADLSETSTSTSSVEVTPSPEIAPGCALPFEPAIDFEATRSNGRRFGSTPNSRVELKLNQKLLNNFLVESSISLEFRTTPKAKPDGILFFLSDLQFVDYHALYMKGGRLFFSWNVGSGSATLGNYEIVSGTPLTFNDTEWHKVTFGVKLKSGRLQVDSLETLEGQSPGESLNLNVISPAYIGGLTPEARLRARQLIQDVGSSFPGCIRNVVIRGQPYSFDEPEHSSYETILCSNKIEPGNFFSGRGGLACTESFRVGSNLEIKFEIKSRNTSGLLMASFSGQTNGKTLDYMIVKVVEGQVVVTINNGAGPKDSVFSLNDQSALCDGNWHSIRAWKLRNLHFVEVDGKMVEPVAGSPGIDIADTVSPLYIGDIPSEYRAEFPDLPSPYIGCLRNVQLARPVKSGFLLKLDLENCVGSGVTMATCPTI